MSSLDNKYLPAFLQQIRPRLLLGLLADLLQARLAFSHLSDLLHSHPHALEASAHNLPTQAELLWPLRLFRSDVSAQAILFKPSLDHIIYVRRWGGLDDWLKSIFGEKDIVLR